ncbi:uncharacterized protein LOC141646463 [Silene latifolia]|uniref:uncharacterized protein LOC141646463 n=1 Tax=Silene latifolia TaxID=37657 RepID=UPI003D781A70
MIMCQLLFINSLILEMHMWNYDCHTRALLTIQVTELVDGVFIGFTISHSVVDDTSFMHFISMLSEFFCSISSTSGRLLEISRVPVYEHKPCIKLPYLGLEEVMTRHEAVPLLKDRVFHLSSKSLGTIKAKANNQEGSISNLSSFQALVSLIWRAITRARNLSAGQVTTCQVAMNALPRVNPPLSDDYFGNYAIRVMVTCNVGELLNHDLGWVARLSNDEIKAHDNNSIRGRSKLIGNLITTPGFLSKLRNS